MRSLRTSLLDPGFKYIPAHETDVASTWKRFGFDPRANERRRERLRTRPSIRSVPAILSLKSA